MPLPFTSRFAVDMTARVSLKKDIRTENMAAVMIPGCQCLPSPCTEAEALMGRCGNIRIQHQYHQQWGIHVLVCFPARVIIPSEAARFFEQEEAFVPATFGVAFAPFAPAVFALAFELAFELPGTRPGAVEESSVGGSSDQSTPSRIWYLIGENSPVPFSKKFRMPERSRGAPVKETRRSPSPVTRGESLMRTEFFTCPPSVFKATTVLPKEIWVRVRAFRWSHSCNSVQESSHGEEKVTWPAAVPEDTWEQIAVNADVNRSHYYGVTGAQVGYCTRTLDELWTGARPFFSLTPARTCGSQPQPRRKTAWRSKHMFYIFLM